MATFTSRPHQDTLASVSIIAMVATPRSQRWAMSCSIRARRVYAGSGGTMMLESSAPRLLSVLRIVAALLYLLHGTSKLFGVPPTPSGATVPLASRLGVASVIEIVGGTLILIGLFTSVAAFICSGEMAVA